MTRAKTVNPVHVVDWDVLAPVPALNLTDGQQTAPVRMLVRLGSEPLGYLDLDVEDASSFPGAAAASASRSDRAWIAGCSRFHSSLSRGGTRIFPR